MNRRKRQKAVYEWVRTSLGIDATKPFERALRVVEEALELAQSAGIAHEQVTRILDHVYSRPAGRMDIEAGDVGVAILAFCESLDLSADELEEVRVEYALTLDPEVLAKRVQEKMSDGIAHGTCALCGKPHATQEDEADHNTGACGCGASRALCWQSYCGQCESIYAPGYIEKDPKDVCQTGGFVCRICNRTLEEWGSIHEASGSYSCCSGCGKWGST